MQFTVERITSLDAQQLEQLTLLLQQLSQAANEQLIQQAVASTQNHVLIAKNDKAHIVGTLTVAMTPCATGVRVHIEDVVVDKAWQRQGIATMLIKEAIRCSEALGARTVDLTSRPDREAANRLYKSLGFVQRDTNVYRYQAK